MTEPTEPPELAKSPPFSCCGVRVDTISEDAVLRLIEDWHRIPMHRTIHFCNAYTLSLAARSAELATALNGATLNLPDGNPVVWVGQLKGAKDLAGRMAGPDFMKRVIDHGQILGLRHFFYGSQPEVLAGLVAAIHRLCPDAIVAGVESPTTATLTVAQEEALVLRLRSCAPDIVWIALGTPAQDLFTETYLLEIPATFVAVGAAFDFISGSKRRAPRWLQSIAGEWLFRLVQEPKRLWRRYLIDSMLFFYFAAKSDYKKA